MKTIDARSQDDDGLVVGRGITTRPPTPVFPGSTHQIASHNEKHLGMKRVGHIVDSNSLGVVPATTSNKKVIVNNVGGSKRELQRLAAPNTGALTLTVSQRPKIKPPQRTRARACFDARKLPLRVSTARKRQWLASRARSITSTVCNYHPPTRSQPTPAAAAPLCGMVLFQALTERLPLKTGFCKSDTSQIVTGSAVSVERRRDKRGGGGQQRAGLTALVALTARHPSNKSHTTLPPPPLFLSGRAHLRG